MSVTLRQVVAAARSRGASLAAESAGYILLAVADQVAIAPRRVSLSGVELGDEGRVRLSSSEPCSAEIAEAELRALLEQLLLVASSSTPALMRVSRSGAESAGLGALVRELEAALIPVNRAAAQRALARLVRETARALERGLELEEEPERLESPLVSALLVTPAPVAEARRTPSVPPSRLILREVSSPAPPVAMKLPVKLPEVPIPALEPPLARVPVREDVAPAIPGPRLELVPAAVEPEFEVDVEVEVHFEGNLVPERPAREAETRPEPVVRRSVAPAGAAPPAPSSSPVETPRLGTLVAVAAVLQEGPPEYDLTERMPPVALEQDREEPTGEQPGAQDAAAAEPNTAEAVAAESVEVPASVEVPEPVEVAVGEARELAAEPSEVPIEEPHDLADEPAAEVDAVGAEPDVGAAGDAISEEPYLNMLPEPLDEMDIVIEEGPMEGAVELEFADGVGALGLAVESTTNEVVPEVPIELAFTPSPHRAATVTLEELRGPNFEPEPDYEPEPLPLYEPEPEPEPTPPSLPHVQLRREPLRSEVQDLLRGFRNETTPSEPDISRELRMLAGLDLTPPPTTAGER